MPNPSEKIRFTTIGLLFLMLSFCSPLKEEAESGATGTPRALPADKIPPIFQEAMDYYKRYGLFFDENQPFMAKTVSDFNTYLGKQDPYAEYLQSEAYEGYKITQSSQYAGIGMEIEKKNTGDFACFPFIGSPAWESGIANGDILVSVNGEGISGLSIYTVASKLMGTPGTKVEFKILSINGERRSFDLTRALIRTKSVSIDYRSGIPIVKITCFANSTKRELKQVLSQLPDLSPVVLDLRDNPGGDLYKAIDSAMLLLEKNKNILTIKSRHTKQAYESTTPAIHANSLIYIWQNQNTASAAEVFTAALTANQRAQSIGTKSYGKGITQDVVELSDGAAIIFTSGYLLPPDGVAFHQRGLEPTHKLVGDRLTTDNFMRKTKQLLQLPQAQEADKKG